MVGPFWGSPPPGAGGVVLGNAGIVPVLLLLSIMKLRANIHALFAFSLYCAGIFAQAE
jgi:hypothetical protein